MQVDGNTNFVIARADVDTDHMKIHAHSTLVADSGLGIPVKGNPLSTPKQNA